MVQDKGRVHKGGVRARGAAGAVLAAFLLSGCYHAVVNTGIQPGPRTVEEKWAMSYIGGLVPPETVDAQDQCGESGVARVETKHSFLNQVVAALTVSIFTPMEIVVTCGRGGGEDAAAPSVDAEEGGADAASAAKLTSPVRRKGRGSAQAPGLER